MKERAMPARAGRKQAEEQVLALWEAGIVEVAAAMLEQAKRGDVRSQLEIVQRVLGKATTRRSDGAADPNAVPLRIIIDEGPAQQAEQPVSGPATAS